jgi:hypothetical protein
VGIMIALVMSLARRKILHPPTTVRGHAQISSDCLETSAIHCSNCVFSCADTRSLIAGTTLVCAAIFPCKAQLLNLAAQSNFSADIPRFLAIPFYLALSTVQTIYFHALIIDSSSLERLRLALLFSIAHTNNYGLYCGVTFTAFLQTYSDGRIVSAPDTS